jgi:hypothetical protein
MMPQSNIAIGAEMSPSDPDLEIISVEELTWMHPLVREIFLTSCRWTQDYVDAGIEKRNGTLTEDEWLDRVRHGGAIIDECWRQLREIFPHDILTGGYRD